MIQVVSAGLGFQPLAVGVHFAARLPQSRVSLDCGAKLRFSFLSRRWLCA